jgi:Domain of unknown function (DUF4253)
LTSESKEQRPISKDRIEQRYRFEYLDQSRWQIGAQSGKLSTQPQPCQSDDAVFKKIDAIFQQFDRSVQTGSLTWPFIGKAYLVQIDQAEANATWLACSRQITTFGYQAFWVSGRSVLADLIEHITTYLSFDSENYLWQPRRPETRTLTDALSELEGHWEPFLCTNKNPPVKPAPVDLIAQSEKIDLTSWFELNAKSQRRLKTAGKDTERSTEQNGTEMVECYGEKRWSNDEASLPCIFVVKAEHAWHVPALFYFGGHGNCPPPQVHSAVLKHWELKYDAGLYAIGRNLLEIKFASLALHPGFLPEVEIYCPGSSALMVDGSTFTMRLQWNGT